MGRDRGLSKLQLHQTRGSNYWKSTGRNVLPKCIKTIKNYSKKRILYAPKTPTPHSHSEPVAKLWITHCFKADQLLPVWPSQKITLLRTYHLPRATYQHRMTHQRVYKSLTEQKKSLDQIQPIACQMECCHALEIICGSCNTWNDLIHMWNNCVKFKKERNIFIKKLKNILNVESNQIEYPLVVFKNTDKMDLDEIQKWYMACYQYAKHIGLYDLKWIKEQDE